MISETFFFSIFWRSIKMNYYLDSDLLSSIESQSDFIFNIRLGRTNFSSQRISCAGNQQNDDDDDLAVISDTEIGLIS